MFTHFKVEKTNKQTKKGFLILYKVSGFSYNLSGWVQVEVEIQF